MSVTVRLPAVLRQHTGGEASVVVEGATLGEVLRALEAAHPAVGRRVCDEQGSVRRHVTVFVGDTPVRDLCVAVPSGSTVSVLAAVSGG